MFSSLCGGVFAIPTTAIEDLQKLYKVDFKKTWIFDYNSYFIKSSELFLVTEEFF